MGEKFRLTADAGTKRVEPRLAKDREVLLRWLLDKAEWTPRDFSRFEMVFTKYADTTYPGEFDEDFYFEMTALSREFKRIAMATPFPSTARVRVEFSRPSREKRAVDLWNRIVENSNLRRKALRPTMKVRKTRAAITREENRVFGGDPELQRLERARKRLEKAMPNLQSVLYWHGKKNKVS